MDLLNLKHPHQLDGKSIIPLLKDPDKQWGGHGIISGSMGDSLRTEEFRYIKYIDGSEELYDHRKDHNEWTNLANDPEYAEHKAELQQELSRWMKECGDQGQQTELEALEHQGRSRQSKDTRRTENTGKP